MPWLVCGEERRTGESRFLPVVKGSLLFTVAAPEATAV